MVSRLSPEYDSMGENSHSPGEFVHAERMADAQRWTCNICGLTREVPDTKALTSEIARLEGVVADLRVKHESLNLTLIFAMNDRDALRRLNAELKSACYLASTERNDFAERIDAADLEIGRLGALNADLLTALREARPYVWALARGVALIDGSFDVDSATAREVWSRVDAAIRKAGGE